MVLVSEGVKTWKWNNSWEEWKKEPVREMWQDRRAFGSAHLQLVLMKVEWHYLPACDFLQCPGARLGATVGVLWGWGLAGGQKGEQVKFGI